MFISNLHWGLVIRLLTVFSLCSILPVTANQAGKQKITVVASDVSLETVFKQIERQTGLRFMYAVDAVNVNEHVTVAFKKTMLDEVLEALLGEKGIVWQYREGTISLKVERRGVSILPINEVESITVSGRVLDAKGDPVSGVTVRVNDGKRGTKTDENGFFKIDGIEVNSVLVVSAVGFETKRILVTSTNIIVKMKEVIGNLDETIVRGYGTITQRRNTGNITSIKAADIEKQPVSDPLLTLQGRVPGMTITQTTGLSGGRVNVQIRGRNSLNNGTIPLFIVDGVPYQPEIAPTVAELGALGGIISALNFINPSDIESIHVLKDADATAIYGSRGANGVVLITTKKGKIGSMRVNVSVSSGWESMGTKMHLLNTKEYLEMRREAFRNDRIEPNAMNAPDLFVWDTTRYTDWQEKLIGGTANYTNAQAGLSGGTDAFQYLLSANYHRQTTIFPGDFSTQRGGVHLNLISTSLNKKFRSSLTTSYSLGTTNFPGVDFASQTNLPPNAPEVYNADGTLNWENSTWQNPYAQLVTRILDTRNNNLITNIDANYLILPELVIRANIGYNELMYNSFSASTIAGVDPKESQLARASAVNTNNKVASWISEPQITYNKNFGDNNLNILIGATFMGTRNNNQTITMGGIAQDGLIRNPEAASTYAVFGSGSKYKYVAFFGRAGYNYRDKYLLNATLRRDGSSRFGPRKQFATFGSIGVAWIFSEENILKRNNGILSFGKLRGSYGITGNDQIGDYKYLDNYKFVGQPYQGVKGLKVEGLFNPDFVWERTKKAELGLETGFFKDKLLLSMSYYENKSDNQLQTYTLPITTGFSLIHGNRNIVIKNSGVELVISSKNFQTKNFEWRTSFNISTIRNKLVSTDGISISRDKREGESLNSIGLYEALGVDSIKGEYLFAASDGKPAPALFLAERYRKFIDLTPSYFGGISNSIKYRSFSFDVFFQFVKQIGFNGLYSRDYLPGKIRNQPIDVLNRWRNPGDITNIQRFSQNSALSTRYSAWFVSDQAYVNASFIRCKNISLSWQMPEKLVKLMNMNSARIYFNGQNLFTITQYSGRDPETQSMLSIPPLRILTLGFQFGF